MNDPKTVLDVLYGTAGDAPKRAERELARQLRELNLDFQSRVPETMRKAAVGAVVPAWVPHGAWTTDGRCDVTAELDIQGVQILTRQAEVKLNGMLPLREGIRLLPEQDYARVA